MNSPATIQLPVEQPATDTTDCIFKSPLIENAVFDFGLINRQFLDNLYSTGEPKSPPPVRTLFPSNFNWTTPDGKQRIPVPLSEFCAYKAALAYEHKRVIKRNLGNARDFTFFNSNRKKKVEPNASAQPGADKPDGDDDGTTNGVADTQGFGFTYDGMIFIVMRGTESKADWAVNLDDKLTDNLQADDQKLINKLMSEHGEKVTVVLPRIKAWKGLHLGFAVAWAAIADKVDAFLKPFENSGMPIIFVGHSLGGALAMVGASQQPKGRVGAVITFGAPEVGTRDFKTAYAALDLERITVRFEAKGDSVPSVMRSYSYLFGTRVRNFILQIADQGPRYASNAGFATIAAPYQFAAVPPLTPNEVVSAIAAIKEARRKADEERRKEEEEKTKPKPKLETKSEPKPVAGGAVQSVGTGKPASGAQGTVPSAGATAAGKSGDNSGGGLIVVGVVVGLFVLVGLYIFARHKLACHAISERYALFLSTLSYQKIRSLRASEPGTTDEKLKRANDDLDKYMHFIRGDTGGGVRGVRRKEATYFADSKLDVVPVKLDPKWDIQTFTSEASNMI